MSGSGLHPLLAAEVQRWFGDTSLPMEVECLLDALSIRLEVIDDVRASDSTGELEAFFRLSGDFLVVIDDQLQMRHLNTAFLTWGFGVAECRGKSFLELIAPNERESTRATLESMLRTHEQVPLSTRVVTATGEQRVVHWQLTTDDVGRRIYAVGRDVTNQQSLEEQLGQARRLEAIGQLAAGVAHEVNTPLQFLGDNVTFIAESLDDLGAVFDAVEERGKTDGALHTITERADLPYLRDELPRAVAAVREGLGRVATLVRSLKALAPSDGEAVSATEPADLVPAFEAVVHSAQQDSLRGAEVVRSFEPLPPVVCHLGDLNKVLVNLLANASQAIVARHGDLAKGRVVVSSRVEGDQAVISVEDNGTGIPEAIRSRVFEPFFTTRDVGSSGQGLAVARSVIERHHGTITFDSTPDVGTVFTLRLPMRPASMEADLWG
jgi:PAS domain S-box-containing protein